MAEKKLVPHDGGEGFVCRGCMVLIDPVGGNYPGWTRALRGKCPGVDPDDVARMRKIQMSAGIEITITSEALASDVLYVLRCSCWFDQQGIDLAASILGRNPKVEEATRAQQVLWHTPAGRKPGDEMRAVDDRWVVEGSDTPSTGYRGQMGYGWLGFNAGHIRNVTIEEYIRGVGIPRMNAESKLASQKRREQSNADAFQEYLNA